MSAFLIKKRQNGRYYTEGNPFVLKPFVDWAESINLKQHKVLEPFAGSNNIIKALQTRGYAKKFASYDIEPTSQKVNYLDTIKNFPKGFDVCITNPPWLAKNSAHRRGLDFPTTNYDDLYKYALSLCLDNCPNVAALVPATFLQSRIFMHRLQSVIFLHDKSMFNDTENPVCLALFKNQSKDVDIFFDSKYIGRLNTLNKLLPTSNESSKKLIFNDPQ